MRQIVLDTETTGLETTQGHRIIEIGCVELNNRRLTGRHYHQYIKPECNIDEGAIEIHGITNEFLANKPVFKQVANEFLDFVRGAELIIHNAPFDVGFINHEFELLGDNHFQQIHNYCSVTDTLVIARKKHPGQKNNLNALCKRYNVDNSQRDLHGALLDAEILADVYLLMTGGQISLLLNSHQTDGSYGTAQGMETSRQPLTALSTPVIYANEKELVAHRQKLKAVDKVSGGKCVWLRQSEHVK